MVTEGRFNEAADMLTKMGARPEDSLARLLAAQSHVLHGRKTEGESSYNKPSTSGAALAQPST